MPPGQMCIRDRYTANPSLDPNAEFIPLVDKIDAAIIGSAGDSTTSVGTGGMITKIRSCRILMTDVYKRQGSWRS